MDLEASIVERLEKLREWQMEQQERLLKQQKIQRDILTQKQDCIYKALELSIQELDHSDAEVASNSDFRPKLQYNGEDVSSSLEEDIRKLASIHCILKDNGNCNETSYYNQDVEQSLSNFVSPISKDQMPERLYMSIKEVVDENIPIESTDNLSSGMTNYKSLTERGEKQIAQFLMEGVAPLSSDKPPVNHVSIDDVPIRSLKKDFQTLLEERLKDCENTHQVAQQTNSNIKIKRPFLKKGQGLSRFRLHPNTNPSTRRRSSSLNLQSTSKQNKSQDTKHKDTAQKVKNTHPQKSISANVKQQQLSLKNVPLPKKKFRSKSESSSVAQSANCNNQSQKTAELNVSDFHTKTQKEMEEMRIFELLEEKAENSSFCSTSSAVMAFLQQSTPCKIKKKINGVATTNTNLKESESPMKKLVKDPSLIKKIARCTVLNGIQQQAKHTQLRTLTNKCNDSFCEIKSPISHRKTQHSLDDSGDTNVKTSCAFDKCMDIQQHNSLREYNQQKSYNHSSSVSTNEVDVSLHVRFSEYNEYKTIGLTDTSSVSEESVFVNKFSEDKTSNDSFTPETSDTETGSIRAEKVQLPRAIETKIKNVTRESKSVQCNTSDDLNYLDHSPRKMNESINYIYCKQRLEDICNSDEDLESSDITEQYSDPEQSIIREHNKQSVASGTSTCLETDDYYKTNEEADESVIDIQNNENAQEKKESIFKSELLKSRLLELEQEIDIFRKENAALFQQRKKLQEDHIKLRKQYAEKEKTIEENKRQAEIQLQEDRRKLTREKTALEGRLKDAQEKAQQSKLERQEVQNLREEVEKLKDELNVKESRWNAAQSRHKCQIRILKMENSKLKQDLEKLQNSKKSNTKNITKPVGLSNTKAIHQINKQLNRKNVEKKKVIENSSDSDEKMVAPMMEALNLSPDVKNIDYGTSNCVKSNKDQDNKCITSETIQKTEEDIAKKRELYQTLLKEATFDLTNSCVKSSVEENLTTFKSYDEQSTATVEKRNANVEENYVSPKRSSNNSAISNHVNENNNMLLQNDYPQFSSFLKTSRKNHESKPINVEIQQQSPIISTKTTDVPCESNAKADKQGIRQVVHPDGRIEYWYPNGNVKKIFPDQGITKMLYYNGDVRETDKDGRVKYFYSSTRTWHTTMPDGLEILEFADGQVEKRLHNGVTEISFPDGSIRVLQSDGSEKWTLPDGTIIETFSNDEKILTLPNGQREIHTKDHKRREYPDGTVKIVYPDGIQETRYANGRTRLKDKDGNLLMDSYQ